MIYLIPFLNALFGWSIIAVLFYFLFRPMKKKNFFIFEIQGFIPKNILQWGNQLGDYASTNFINISSMKESLLNGEKMNEINKMLEEKVDDFLRNKLKEKVPVLSMFITDGLVSKMKEVLMEELKHMIPSTIDKLASDMEKKFDAKKLIAEKLNNISMEQIEKAFYSNTGKSITTLKFAVALFGFALGWLEVLLLTI